LLADEAYLIMQQHIAEEIALVTTRLAAQEDG